MRKIDYPIDILTFENDYYVLLQNINENGINIFLSGIALESITFRDLVTAKFEDLINYYHIISQYLTTQNIVDNEQFFSYFDYESCQPIIADFFMKRRNDLELKTCFYCNIDFINSFNDLGEYKDKIHFLNKATKSELRVISGLGEKKVELIYNQLLSYNISNIEELNKIKGIGESTIDKINNFNLEDLVKLKNHFTLDHFLPKSELPYFSLSLYNFIPSCFSCNSKFKGVKKFVNFNNMKFLSPSSSLFSLNNDLEFKLFYNVDGIDLKDKIKNVELLNDIRVDIENIGTIDEFDTYLEMFKLKGRYIFHKNESLKLIKKRKRYSDSEIDEIAKITHRDKDDIKKDVFGTSIFNDDEKNEPFAKYKSDIAKQLGLLD